VNARLVVTCAVALAVGGGLALPALASQPENRHVVCVGGPTPDYPNQQGFCVGISDPLPN
jgi:hypothetical protein